MLLSVANLGSRVVLFSSAPSNRVVLFSSAMDLLDGPCLWNVTEDCMNVDDSEDELLPSIHPMSPVEHADAVCPGRISLASLWPGASVTSHAETDDISISHAASASASLAQGVDQFVVPLQSDFHLPTSSVVSPPRNISLDVVFPNAREQILTWHPNRVFFAIIYVLHQRLSPSHCARRRVRGKQSDTMHTLKNWMATRDFRASGKFPARHRGAGRDMYRRIVSGLTGNTIRAVVKATGSLWEELGIDSKNSWGQLAALVKRREVENCARDLLLSKSDHEHRIRPAGLVPVQQEEPKKKECRGYGVSLCFNTSLGQDDVEVIRILQTGLVGQELRTALAEVACYSKFIDACWAYFEPLGKEIGLPLVACGMEHSENGSHPARVHVHVFMGMEVRGSFFDNNQAMISFPEADLIWNGLKPGWTRPTLVSRKTHTQIHKAILQAYYYVAGPKKTQMLLRCSAQVHKEKGQPAGNTLHIFKDLFNVFGSNLVRLKFVAIQIKKTRCVKDCDFVMVVRMVQTLLNPIVNVSC